MSEHGQHFRDVMYAYLTASQTADGSWAGNRVGPEFGTTTALTILQLEYNWLPIYMR